MFSHQPQNKKSPSLGLNENEPLLGGDMKANHPFTQIAAKKTNWSLIAAVVALVSLLLACVAYYFVVIKAPTKLDDIPSKPKPIETEKDSDNMDQDIFLPLGRTVTLSKKNIYELVAGGTTVFPESMKKCFERMELPASKIQMNTFTNAEDMAKSTSAGLGISFSRKGLSGTLQGVYEKSEVSRESRASVLIDYFVPRASVKVNEKCMKNSSLDYNLLRDLYALPETIKDTRIPSSWAEYEQFLSVYGSHVVNGVDLGARVVTWIVQKENHQVTLREMKLSACLQYSSVSGSIDGCASYNQTGRSDSHSDSFDKKVYILGGSKDARDALLSHYDQPNLLQFIKSSSSLTPARYHYLPIWSLIRSWLAAHGAVPEKMFKVLTNMEAYYEGFLNSNCVFTGRRDGEVLRQFVYNNGRYVCENRPEGCISDRDCYYQSTWECRCRDCIRHIGEDKMPSPVNVPDNDGAIRNHCKFRGPFDLNCDCKNPIHMEIIWPLSLL